MNQFALQLALYRIAINEVNLYYRKSKRTRQISIESVDYMHVMEDVQEEDTNEERKNELFKAMNHLNEKQVQLIELRYFQNLSFKEIAAIYGITENNAKVKVYRILEKLKKIIKGVKTG